MGEKTSDKIIKYITVKGQVTGKDLAYYFHEISSRAVRKQLKNLLEKRILQRVGRPPKVFYSIATDEVEAQVHTVKTQTYSLIEKRYLFISPTGEELSGWTGFVAWCKKTNQDPVKTATEYVRTLRKYDVFRKGGMINGMVKMKQTFTEVFLDTLFYLDFYSIERFGKTKLGQILLYSKQSQNIKLIKKLVEEVRPQILNIIIKNKIDAILYIPPTVKRELQLMKELERHLKLTLPTLMVVKVKTPITIPQKTLTKLDDRIENARQTIIVDDTRVFTNILLIDDAVGSGASLNETARQIRYKKLSKGKIVGLAITGSFKGFDIISEV